MRFAREDRTLSLRWYPEVALALYGDLYLGTFPDAVLGAVAMCYELELLACGDDGEGRGIVCFGVAQCARDIGCLREFGLTVEECNRLDIVIEIIGMGVFVTHFDGNLEWLARFGGIRTVDKRGVSVDQVFFGFSLYF